MFKNLKFEESSPANAAFKDEMNEMIDDLDSRLKVYLENRFLIIASLLDPRFTKQMEIILKKSFAEMIPMILDFAQEKNGSNDGAEELNSTVNNEMDSKISTGLNDYSFWSEDVSVPIEIPEKQQKQKDRIEVIKNTFLILCFCAD